MRIHDAQHRVGRDRGVDGIAAIAQDLRTDLGSGPMRCYDDAFGHAEIIGPKKLSRRDELDGSGLNLKQRGEEPHGLAVYVKAHFHRRGD